jgi:hypothetical protein
MTMYDVNKMFEIENELIVNVISEEMNDKKTLSYIAGVVDAINVIMLKVKVEENKC